MQNWVPTRWLPTLWILSGEWRAHPVRMGLAVLAIAVGVALGFAVHMVNSAALASFGRAVASVQGRADVAVRARSAAGLEEGLYPKLARLPQVQAINSQILSVLQPEQAAEFDEALARLQDRAQALLAERSPDLPKANRRQGQRGKDAA